MSKKQNPKQNPWELLEICNCSADRSLAERGGCEMSDTPRKVDLTGPDWMIAAMRLACVCDVIGHKCIGCHVAERLESLERESASKDATIARLREAADALLIACDRVKYGASEYQVNFMDDRAEKLRAALNQE